MKRKFWRAFCSYFALYPFEKDDEVIVFFEATHCEETRETGLYGLPPSFHLYAGHGYTGLAQPCAIQVPQTATSDERFRHVNGTRLSR